MSPAIQADTLVMTREDINKAYPTFYGCVVSATQTVPDAEGKYRVNLKYVPYGVWDNENKCIVSPEAVSKTDGSWTKTYFVRPGDMAKSYTAIHQLVMGFRDQKVQNGDLGRVGGHEGWFKTTSGAFSNIFPTSMPKGATIPARPDDFDFESWVAEHGSAEEDAEMGGGTEGLLPEDLFDRVVELSIGKSKAQAIRVLAEEKGINEYDVPTLQRTVAALVEAGRLGLDDGKYVIGG